MTSLDWFLVLAINGSIILVGLWLARGTRNSVDWFLAAKGLPWWMVGLSMFATAVDSGDYVAVAGGAYDQGMAYISAWWLGLGVGWCLVSYIVFVPMYRAGMFTNAEYLEYRFGPAARVISVLIQIQTRTNVMANVAMSLYLTFSIITGWGPSTWWMIVAIAAGAGVYTAMGGLRSVAVTDTMQSIVMLMAAVALWWTVWNAVGGWNGLEEKLSEHVAAERLAESTARAMTHVGSYDSTDVPSSLVVMGFIIVLSGYCVINQSQAMRLLAARSVWDMKMAAIVATAVTAVVMWFNITLGILGRAVVPDLERTDAIFPKLIEHFLPTMQAGLLGIVVAGLLAGGLSTYDSIGSALASVFTRDVYARFVVRSANDHHYLTVSRIVTLLFIAISFAYIPFLKLGMLAFYLKISGVAVVPLFAVYLMGVLTRAARRSATVGLIAGILCGATRFIDPLLIGFGLDALPVWWTNTWWGYLWSIAATVGAMLVTSMVVGWASREEVSGLTIWSSGKVSMREGRPRADSSRGAADQPTWLETSRADVPVGPEYPVSQAQRSIFWTRGPLVLAVLLLLVLGYLNVVVFW